jgi:excisionase family DNA binding protein
MRKSLDGLLTAAEAAKLLHVHVNTLRRWTDNGMLEAYRIGPRGDRRLRRRSINDFVAGMSRNSTIQSDC